MSTPAGPLHRSALLLAICAGVPLASCLGGGGAGENAAASDGRMGTLVIAEASDANNMIGVVSQSASDSNIISNIFYPVLDSEFDCELTLKPGIAKSWAWSEDGTVLSMELRDDLKWQDGEPVDAEDIAFTMGLVENPIVASPRIAYLKNMKEGMRPKVVDSTHIEWHFTKAYDKPTQAAHASSVAPLPQHILSASDPGALRGDPFNREPMVNGLWKIGSWDPGQRIVLEPNDKFTGDAAQSPKLRRVIFRVLPEYNTRLVELEKGTIDLMQSIRIADADRLAEEHPEIKLYRRGWRAMDYVGWNNLDPDDLKEKKKAAEDKRKTRFAVIDSMGVSDEEKETLKREATAQFKVKVADVAPHPLWGDTAVRVALTKAIDRKKIIKDLLTSDKTGESYGRESVSTITPELCKAHANDIEPIGYNPEEAKAELAALGWTDSDGDGILDKDGKAFSFTLETNSENPRRADAAIIIQANLKQIGVEVQIEKLEFNTFSEKHRNRDFHASLGGWSAGLFVDPAVIWGDPDENDFNFIAYDNEEVQALIEKGLSTPDPDDAAPIWREVQETIYAEQPYTFLYWRDEIVGLHERFENAKIDVLSPYRDLHEWSVPADKVKYKR